MERRNFIQNASMVVAAASLPYQTLTLMKDKKYKLGYQLYSIRDQMEKDPIATLKSLKAMGYEDFEVYGYDHEQKTFYNMKAEDFKAVLDDMGLNVSSGHYLFAPHMEVSKDKMRGIVASCVEGAHKLGSAYVTWPYMMPEQRTLENYKKLPELLSRIGEQVKEAGLGFAYHNHGFEFEDHNGETGFDIIVSNTDPDTVKLQMDMYWVMHAGTTTPKALVDAHPGRFTMWHVKDMDVMTRDYTELGNGSINYKNVLPSAEKSGMEYYYIEQGGNFTKNSTDSASSSAEYFKKHLSSLI